MASYLVCCNQTRRTLVADRVKKADNYWLRLIGLLPKKRLEPGEGLWIVPCRDIHSIGMRFEFDAIFLDKNLQVVHMVERMKPFRVTPLIVKAQTVLEVSAGVVAATQTELGDQLIFNQDL